MRINLLALVAAACMLVPGSSAVADGRPMQLSGATSQPIGHYEFCQRYATECRKNAQVGLIRLTQAAWKEIVAVNKAVNSSIFPRTDEEVFGKAEYWEYPKTEGDCEDFALLKQYMLEKAGYPASALLLTVARQPNGDGHAVLTVRTDRGDFVLDNLEERVLDWSDSDLRFLKRQSERNSAKWLGIDDDRGMLVGSVK